MLNVGIYENVQYNNTNNGDNVLNRIHKGPTKRNLTVKYFT